MSFKARRIARIGFTVSDLARAEDFYSRLGFGSVMKSRLGASERALLSLPYHAAERLVMRLGAQEVEFLRVDPPGRPYPMDSTATDGWFQHIAIVVDDMPAAVALVLDAGATPVTEGGPQRLPANTGRVTAYKFRDPEGHPLELIAFPPDVGDPVWHGRVSSSPFLGIDHTAIVVANSEASVGFYKALGFSLGERSFNLGPAQTRLDDVAADVVEVVALTLPRTPPHLELLNYRTGTRRSPPPGGCASDIAATRIILAVERREEADATMIQDPDGHRLIVESDTSL